MSDPAAPTADDPPDSLPEPRAVWPGGPALWLGAAPVVMTCGNFGLLLALSYPPSPIHFPEVDRFLGTTQRFLGGGLLGDAAIMAGITASAMLPGVAYILRRDGTTGRGWRNAGLYGMLAWVTCTVGGVAMLSVIRHLPL